MLRVIAVLSLALLQACIADLPEAEFPCLIETGSYDRYNEAYVFSPQGEKKREAMERIREAERACVAASETSPSGPGFG